MGFSVGDRVALYLPKGPDYVVLLLALIRAGIVACPVSTRLPPGGVAPLLRGAGCYDLISDTEALIGATDSGTKNLGTKDLIDDSPGAPPEPASPRDVPLDRPSTIVFTSGSTGTPKAALHTFGNHYFNALGSNENIALAPGDRWLHSLPLYHVGGLSILFRCLLAGATVALPEPGVGLGESVSKLGVTHVSLVSTQLRRLLDEGTVPSGLKAVLMGGGPIPPSLVDESLARGGLPIHTSYGLTEMASQVTSTPPGASRGELRTAGRSLPYREVRVSEDGEILVRGPTLFAGYLEGEIPKLPLDEEGWFHTGDLGEMDAGGRLAIVGRRDNMFVSGGENVQPEEIEAALCRIEGVEEAVVVPVPDPEFGARAVAFVRKGGRVGDLAQKLKKSLPGFKIPKAFHNWEGSGGMKPDRASLARRARPARDAETEP
jgi:O-succinylbenzoic acid--CoA ligase